MHRVRRFYFWNYAALAGGMKAVGIGHPDTLYKAHLNLNGFANVQLQKDILDKL